MSVVTQRKANRSALIVAGLVLISGLAACSKSADTQADTKPDEPAAVSAPSAPTGGDAPLGESTRSASASDSAPPAQAANTMQTAEIAPPTVVKAVAPAAADTSDADADKSASKLSAEQQELAAEVGDTRHAATQAPSDKTPD